MGCFLDCCCLFCPSCSGSGALGRACSVSLCGVVGVIDMGAHAYMCACVRLCTCAFQNQNFLTKGKANMNESVFLSNQLRLYGSVLI